MNRRFLLITDPTPGFIALVLANSAVNPFTVEQEILQELRSRGATGLVAFDLLLCNGHKQNRFFAAYFDGQNLAMEEAIRSGMQLLEEVENALRKAATEILRDRFLELSPSLLSPAMQYGVKKGIAL